MKDLEKRIKELKTQLFETKCRKDFEDILVLLNIAELKLLTMKKQTDKL